MKPTILFLLLIFFSNHLIAQEPLTSLEKREILVRLAELKNAREKIAILEAAIAQDKINDQRESDLNEKALANERRATELAQAEASTWKDKAQTFEAAYNAVKPKKRSFGCTCKKIFTIGIARCK